MQPCSREMQAMNSIFNQDLQPDHDQISSSHLHPPLHLFQSSHFDSSDDFLDQFLSNVPPSSSSWQDLKSPWDLNHSSSNSSVINKLGDLSDETPPSNLDALAFQLEESAGLAAKLRNHQISSSSPAARAAMILQQQQLLSGAGVSNSGLPPMPLSLSAADLERSDNDIVDGPSSFKTPILGGSTQAQSFGAQGSVSGGAPAQSKPKVRARRGQATDPHSIAERLRRERIAERMKSLQELVPNANKTDKASMLDEIIDYVKFLQLQVKVLSMSRLGGAAAVAPLVADISDGGGDRVETNGQSVAKSKQTALPNENLTMTEQQVAQLMEKDMGSAMQYLQGKGLCLMPISLATAISTSTGHSRNPLINHFLSANGDAPASPSMSVLTVQSTTLCANDSSAKDVASVSKP